MRINDYRYKSWKKTNDYRIWKKRLLRKRINIKKHANYAKKTNKNGQVANFLLPENFSIINNASEVVETLRKIKEKVKSDKTINNIYLNMSNVNKITIDALMYLLTFIKNLSISTGRIVGLSGNLPKEVECRNLVVSSGFLKYLRSHIDSEYTTENVHITAGSQTDPATIKNVCDFVQEKFNCDRNSTKVLYNTLGEIIGNATEHAYDDGVRWKKWLTFAKYKDNKIRIVVLDTGYGIIETMSTKLMEKISLFSNNIDLLESALKGEKRSATRLGYRNKGLPRIVDNVKKGFFEKMVLFTNDVCHELVYNKNGSTKIIDCSLDGTLYYLELCKENVVHDN